jgi:formylglycine-generating enzyme required for sulfatase activity
MRKISFSKNILGLSLMAMLAAAGCSDDGGSGLKSLLLLSGGGADPFEGVDSVGESGTVTIDLVSFSMYYVPGGMTFPTDTDDLGGNVTVTDAYLMGETEVTNALMAKVFQWAYDNGKFSTTVADPNGLDSTVAKHEGQVLLNLSGAYCNINYSAGSFTVETGYDDSPAVGVTWYGGIMFCNWLTEMRDGNTSNVVYGNITNPWLDDDTTEDTSKTGYRLPSSNEWELAARYIDDANNDDDILDANEFYPGDYASGADADYDDTTGASDYDGDGDTEYSTDVAVYSAGSISDVKTGTSPNALGLYDMSGNAWEMCFTESGSFRVRRGGAYNGSAAMLQIGGVYYISPTDEDGSISLRIVRTR